MLTTNDREIFFSRFFLLILSKQNQFIMDTLERVNLYRKAAKQYMTRSREFFKLNDMTEEEFDHVCYLAGSVLLTRDKVMMGGSFTQAVVENKLDEAICTADAAALKAIKALVIVKKNCSVEEELHVTTA